LAGPGVPLIDSLFIHHGADFTANGKKRKTYGRFLGMIYFGGVGFALALGTQGLATPKIPKNGKKAKKSVKYFPSDPRFSAKEMLI
jgi:hypothetical protein